MHLSGDSYYFNNFQDYIDYWRAVDNGNTPKYYPAVVAGQAAGFAAGWPSQQVRLQGAGLAAKETVYVLKNNAHVVVDTLLLGTPGLVEEIYYDIDAVNSGKMTVAVAKARLEEKAKGMVLDAALAMLGSKISGGGFTGRGESPLSAANRTAGSRKGGRVSHHHLPRLTIFRAAQGSGTPPSLFLLTKQTRR